MSDYLSELSFAFSLSQNLYSNVTSSYCKVKEPSQNSLPISLFDG